MIAFRDDDEQPSRPRLRDGHQFRGRANLRSLRVRPRTGSPTMRMPLKLRCRSKCNSAFADSPRITSDSSSRNPERRDAGRIKNPCGVLMLTALGCRDNDHHGQN